MLRERERGWLPGIKALGAVTYEDIGRGSSEESDTRTGTYVMGHLVAEGPARRGLSLW